MEILNYLNYLLKQKIPNNGMWIYIVLWEWKVGRSYQKENTLCISQIIFVAVQIFLLALLTPPAPQLLEFRAQLSFIRILAATFRGIFYL